MSRAALKVQNYSSEELKALLGSFNKVFAFMLAIKYLKARKLKTWRIFMKLHLNLFAIRLKN